MKNEHERNTKHQHTYTLNISVKGISYAAIIGVLGFLGFGGADLPASSEEVGRLDKQFIVTTNNKIKKLEYDIGRISQEMVIVTALFAKDNRELIEEKE